MHKLPSDLSGRQVRKALEGAGFSFQRQRGSHMILRRVDPPARVVVPDHKAVRVGTLRHILNEAGLNVMQFLEFLGRA
jgi:predicted RNA binding protein YcfA (HicA-like mRNA interferase family)